MRKNIRWPIQSLLFIPANRDDFISKASRYEPDAVILDLEDALPKSQLPAARLRIKEQIQLLSTNQIKVFVRINSMSEGGLDDLQHLVCKELTGIVVPKIETIEEVQLLDQTLSYQEGLQQIAQFSIDIIALPETALGIYHSFEIAKASPRIQSVMTAVSGPVGGDIAKAVGYEATREGLEQLYVEGKTVLASKAGRAPYPIAGIIGADMNDLQYIEELIKRAKSIGFTGVALIHPKHVAIANRIFRLTAEEVTYHRQLIESYEEGIKKGLGAVRFRDAMIDQAMYERSMELLSNQT